MLITFRILVILLVVIVAALIAGRMGFFRGSRPHEIGLQNGQLAPPKLGRSNSVSSQHAGHDYHNIAPLQYSGDHKDAMAKLTEILNAMTRVSIIEQQANYIYAQASTQWMGYVDDIEFVLDPSAKVIHVRSASRLGRKDFGVNRARIESIRRRMNRS